MILKKQIYFLVLLITIIGCSSNVPIYKGEKKDGNKHGQGKITYTDGSEYIGEFKDDYKDGFGIYSFPNGNIYKGAFKEDLPNGKGVYTKDGSSMMDII